jgi:serine/threonine protein kinase
LSKDNISTFVEDKVRKAYQELHRRKVLHGDIRAGNILVSSNESIYIIDFESACCDAELWLDDEIGEVEKLFGKIRKEREQGLVEVGC